ncbi:MAG: hypothetical protein ACUVQD_01740 [Thermaceae bacterium]
MKRSMRWALLLTSLLIACAPQASPRAKPEFKSVGFYPAITGLEWVYIPEGEPLSSPPYRVRVEGPSSFLGQEALRIYSGGRGEERRYYRLVDRGVRLLGFEDPSARVVFSPPILEYPSEEELRVGHQHRGQTEVRVELLPPGGSPELLRRGLLNYNVEILEKREVRVPAGVFEVYRIRQTFVDEQGETVYEVWFAPYVGEVRTREGRLLVETNFR